MPSHAWYNANEHRDYPFIQRPGPLAYEDPDAGEDEEGLIPTDIPQDAIVDFGAILDVDAGYREDHDHYVYLYGVYRAGSQFRFEFRSNAPGAADTAAIFWRSLDDPEYAIEWVDATSQVDSPSSSSAGSVPADACNTRPLWRAFLATGQFAALAEAVVDGETVLYPRGLWRIEPARVQSLLDSYVRSLNLANLPRQFATTPEDCLPSSESSDSLGEDAAIINAACIQGAIRIREGYNCVIRQEDLGNTIVIGASLRGGAGEPCEEVPRYEGEPDAGGPRCDDLIRTINGVGGRNITIISGQGFRVEPHEDDENTLVIDRTLNDMAACPADSSDLSLTEE